MRTLQVYIYLYMYFYPMRKGVSKHGIAVFERYAFYAFICQDSTLDLQFQLICGYFATNRVSWNQIILQKQSHSIVYT